MKREWKPGDMAAITQYGGARPSVRVPADCGVFTHKRADADHWHHLVEEDGTNWTSFSDAAARPLVVIDPEDREQVDTFTKALVEAMYGHGKHGHAANGIHPDDVTDALHSLITPPKPEEPTGFGAVVEDGSGKRYVRYDRGGDWNWLDGTASLKWQHVPAVRILSEGVRP